MQRPARQDDTFAAGLLRDEVVLVTGGGTGLGRAIATRCAELGARVAICGRRGEVAAVTAAEIAETTGADTLGSACDVRDFAQVEAWIAAAVVRFGRVTALVNNAAGNFLAQSETLSPNAFRTVVDIVLAGSFHATLAAGKQMIAQGSGGSVLSIVTTYAWTGSAFVVPSAAAKAGVLAMTRSLAVEWGRHRIRCNAIAPGPFPTEGAFARLMPAGLEEMARRKVPLGRFGEPRELADLAAFLLSARSGYVNGEVVTIDGGEWLNGGEFNWLTQLPQEQLDAGFAALRAKTGKTRDPAEGQG
ncbi:MAG TPA: SDR family oxidoreductase [Thermoanaerobaculia bacterium]|jgi:NAD(P)-dependent dehydrogenase (short-subunit alcohol dehydrogenase family)|nr:SDR family oxidoreductase [Thermoanaerobaculia bacterium]